MRFIFFELNWYVFREPIGLYEIQLDCCQMLRNIWKYKHIRTYILSVSKSTTKYDYITYYIYFLF